MDVVAVTEDIKRMLGWPVVSVHTPDDTIKANLEKALRKYSSKILTEKKIVVPYSGSSRVDLSEYKPEVVTLVEPELPSESGYSEVNEFDLRTQLIYTSSMRSIQDLAYNRQLQGNLDFILDSFDFEYQEPYLLVDNVPAGVDDLTVTMMVKPTLEEVEATWIEEYALALTKQVEGRIRSKFNGGPMEFETDGQVLIDEGKQEITDLEESLKGKAPLRFARRA